MPDIVKRGYMPSDEKEFIDQIEKLRGAGEELYYLINRACQDFCSKTLNSSAEPVQPDQIHVAFLCRIHI